MENKIANTKYDILSLIKRRWSPRAFDPNRAVSQEDVEAILEAASWAPSSRNEQPWRYYYAHSSDEEGFKKLFDCLTEGNQIWVKNAPLLMAITRKTKFSKNDKPNKTSQHDTGLSNGYLVLEALSRDIYAHMMAGYKKEDTIEALDLDPDNELPVCFMALGYMGDISVLPESKKESERAGRTRKELDEFSKRVR